jgi:hypothetical protein
MTSNIRIFSFILLSFGLTFLIACGSTKTKKQAENPAEVDPRAPKVISPDDYEKPMVVLTGGKTLEFDTFGVRFSLTHSDPLIAHLTSELPWGYMFPATQMNGKFITYTLQGRQLSLREPYIQVEYISKTLPYCSSPDSLYIWLSEQFEQGLPDYKVLKKRHLVKTKSGKMADCKEMFVPKRGEQKELSEKYLAYGYIDYNPFYLIGFNLTAITKEDFDYSIDAFYDILKTYE